MRRFGKFLITYSGLIAIFVGVLVLACSFPSSTIKENVRNSSVTLNEEGNRKLCFIFNKLQFQEFDNFSDALMINTAYSIDSKTPLYAAFTAKKDYIPGTTTTIKEDVVGELKSSSNYFSHNEVGELKDTVNGYGDESFEYAKYWHGYLSLLRPLLVVFDYQQIRVLFTFVFAILAIYSTTLLSEKKNNVIATFYLLSLVFVEYFYIGLSLINSITFLITMIASCVLISKFGKIKDWGFFFFVIGMFVGFLTLLDTPLLTVGLPLILYFIFKNGDGKDNLKETIKFLLFCGVGYFLTWMAKWVLMDLIYHRSLIQTAIGQILYRSSGGESSPILAICINLLSMALPIMLTLLIMMYFFTRYSKNMTKETRKKARIYVILGILPFLWYIVFSNHSANHFFFAYRLLLMSMFGNLLWIYYICGEPGKRDEK